MLLCYNIFSFILSMRMLFVDGLLKLHGQQEIIAVRLEISSPKHYCCQAELKKKQSILPTL